MDHRIHGPIFLGIALLSAARLWADTPTPPAPVDKAPSRDGVLWLGSETSLESTAQADYVGAAPTDLGNGHHGQVSENQVSIRQLIARRFYRCLLVHGGLEWQRFGFYTAEDGFIPPQLHAFNAYLAADFRFSRQDMVRLQARPGVYSDWEENDGSNVNVPLVLAYSHMASRRFQWAVGASMNAWRNRRWLGGGGFRWQMSDRWKLKMMLPEPQIEYRARDDLHVFIGADFRADSFRVSHDFGTRRGRPEFDNALVDYDEIRAGAGFSWNIKPLLELNAQAGAVLDRAFNYHNNGMVLTARAAPYVSINLQMLVELWPHDDHELGTRSPQFEMPVLERAQR